MTTMERVRQLQTDFHLSDRYIANYLGVVPSAVNENQDVVTRNISKLCLLFGISENELTNDVEVQLIKGFENLDKDDQIQIMNLVHLKEQIKVRRNILQKKRCHV